MTTGRVWRWCGWTRVTPCSAPGNSLLCPVPCSLVFGSQLDIHSGGVDLAFPHHENEIAQCEAFHQCPQWGNYFLHSGESRLPPPAHFCPIGSASAPLGAPTSAGRSSPS